MLELYTFFTMGGNMSDIELVVLDTEEWSEHGLHSKEEKVEQAFAHFDAENAQCFDPTEKARLLSVVEAGGGIPKLNELIRELTKINKPQATGGRASMRMSFNSQSTDHST